MCVGFVYATVEVTNITGGGAKYAVPFLVDTGATDTVIPASELDKIGVKREFKGSYELANGTIVSYDTGFAFVNINGKKVAANVVFGDENNKPLLGVTVLESAGLMVDPVHQVLRKLEAIPL